VPAEPADHAVALALVLDLEHDALVGLVGAGGGLGHHAVEAGALEAAEPVLGGGAVGGGGGEVERRRQVCQQRFEELAPLAERGVAEVAVALGEDVPEDDRGGQLAGEQLDARGGGVEAELQRLEVERAVARSGSRSSGK
jgi:hypothetical protein